MTDTLDKAELLERIENDLEFLADAVEVYKEDYPELISLMRDALLRQDSDALADAAHTLKGLFSNLAAHRAVEAAVELQLLAGQGELSAAGQALHALERESDRLKDALEAVVQAG